jgi:hypothetical protein
MGKSRTFVSIRSTFFKIPSIIFVIIHDSGITFIRYSQGQKIEKPNKLKIFGRIKTKGPKIPRKLYDPTRDGVIVMCIGN